MNRNKEVTLGKKSRFVIAKFVSFSGWQGSFWEMT